MMCSSNFRTIAILLLLAISTIAFAQGIQLPQDFGYSNRHAELIDAGILWHSNSTFHPATISNIDEQSLLSNSEPGPRWVQKYLTDFTGWCNKAKDGSEKGISANFLVRLTATAPGGPNRIYEKTGITPELWMHIQMHRHFYIDFDARFTNEGKSLEHFSGRPKRISRASFNTSEIDHAVIGYENNWIKVDYGRSREIWGAMPENNLLLAGSSPAYERLLFQLNHKRFSYRWFYGYLESVWDTANAVDINRYLVGRCFEYNNHKNLVLNLGETIIYSGPNRVPELSYLNPISEHVEIETNARDNSHYNQQNSVFFLGVDWLARKNLRISTTFGADEYRIDRGEQKKFGEALLYFGRVAWTPTYNPALITLFAQGYRIDTYSQQHRYRWDNNLTHGQLIGSPIGNDADDFSAGLRIILPVPVSTEVSYGRMRWGENSMILHPYTAYVKFDRPVFPSGEVRTNRYLAMKLDSQPFSFFSLQVASHIDLSHSGSGSAMERWTVTGQFQVPYFTTSKFVEE